MIQENMKKDFICEHNDCLNKLKSILSEFYIDVVSLERLDRLDPLALPSCHRFRFCIAYGRDGQKCIDHAISRAKLKLARFDIIAFHANTIKTKLSPAINN